MPTTLSEADWRILVRSIDAGRCTPFLGAGVNAGLLPLGGEIAREWAAEYDYPFDDPHERSDLIKVSQYYAVHTKNPMAPKLALLDLMRDRLQRLDGVALAAALGDQRRPLGLLARLRFPIYITTNYDDLLTRALVVAGKTPTREYCRWNTYLQRFNRMTHLPECSEEKPLVFHLHGSDQEVKSLVLTEDDYLDFLINVAKDEDLVLPPRIQRAMAGTLLFIGYRLQDWNFRTVLRGIVSSIDESVREVSVAIQLAPDDRTGDIEKAVAYLERYFEQIKIRTYWGPADEFVQNLRHHLENR